MQNLVGLEGSSMANVSDLLEEWFEKKPSVQNNVLKITANQLKGFHIQRLGLMYGRDDVNKILIKRSGTGVTVIVEVE